MLRFGIYGYECTKQITYANVKIIPLYTTFKEANTLSKDNNAYNLTAFLEISKNNNTEMTLTETREVIHKLEAVLSFIDHRDVIISNQLRHNETYNNLEDDYPRKIETHVRKNGGGCVIINDTFCPKSRELFIEKTMTLLLSEDTPITEAFRKAFFKTIEVFRAKESFVDISYYLLFSALESLCRAIENDYTSKCVATPIKNVLINYGFDIKQDNPQNPQKSVMTYVHLRNALFHNGSLTATTKAGIVFKMKDYYAPLHRLLPLVLIKYTGFDDGKINWNSWLDRIPFISK
ncbi:TPA: hypothetical protein QIW90_001942 [Klebsiella variicola]|nr:hypothetical protein [Klebsiella pneumoniae]HBZ6111943.1 hypothetical protein [Klebsiella pneumoniae]HDE1966236.1 hypothetical protein [Klebsiella pneumoniae]HDU3537332.1 hypothetical protein [Klebsiella variicola]